MRVAGFGFRRAAGPESLRAALDAAGGAGGVSLIAAPEDKAQAPCLLALSEWLQLPLCALDDARLAAAPVMTRSERVARIRGTGSVAEAAALAAAGLGARLVAPRAVSPDRMATCAIAETDAEGDTT